MKHRHISAPAFLMGVLAALVAALIFFPPTGADAHGGITGKYPAPTEPDARGVSCDTVEFDYDNVAHADFYVVRYSTNSDFSDSDYVRPQDFASVEDALDNESVEVNGLDDDDRTYWKVAVSDYEGHRLSPYSKVNVAHTPSC